LADVVRVAMVFAKEMNIDLEDAINRKWIAREWDKK
jgi:NTP pyrophosphatase (non-canonical NTP hydrolase)